MAQTLDPKGTAHVLGGFAYVFLISYGSILICSYPLVVLGKAPCLETFRNSRMIKANVQTFAKSSNMFQPAYTGELPLSASVIDAEGEQNPMIPWCPLNPQDLPLRGSGQEIVLFC